MMHKMFGVFDLKARETTAEFDRAFDEFASFLRDQQLLDGWSFMTRTQHKGYDASPPPQNHLVEMVFNSQVQALQCWDFLEADPFHPLHRKMNQKVTNARFALYGVYKKVQ